MKPKYNLLVYYGDRYDSYTLSCWMPRTGRKSIAIPSILARMLIDKYECTLFKSTNLYAIYSIDFTIEKGDKA